LFERTRHGVKIQSALYPGCPAIPQSCRVRVCSILATTDL